VTKNPETISNAALNALLLERQWLTKPFEGNALELIKSHGVVQTQERFSGEEFLRSRGHKQSKALDELRADGTVVKATLHRCTVHTLVADDFALWQPLYADKLEQTLVRKGWELKEDWRVSVEDILGDGAYKAKDLHELLKPLFPYEDMLFVVRGFIGLTRVPGEEGSDKGGFELFKLPKGLRRYEPEELMMAKRDLARRYLAAFGPARAGDFASWSSLTGAAEVFKSMEDELWQGKDEQGKVLFDILDLPREPTTTPPRYKALPFFDNILLGFGDRTRIAEFTQEERDEFFKGAMAPLLLNGKVVATWINRVKAGKTRVLMKEIKPVSEKDKLGLEVEVKELLATGRQFTGEIEWVTSFLGA
jgi:hypothetical protein